ncbi:hypothetical protein [Herbaspirillum rubrisubalbicans]|uniref:hypothetical protein n=1 Tax=Herbaspirillum rubrisubalbicans TaxID=80842 RepID=UPI000360BE6A|nr:hypothetical protein [Herbaspirillum rubrisubalbicans]
MLIPDAAIGSVIAALIAGLVVFVSTVLAKEQKTSEFRQTWIDELRKDVADYIASVSEATSLYLAKSTDKAEQQKFLDENFSLFQQFQALEHRIVLRLNSSEHSSLIEQVTSLRSKIIIAHRDGGGARAEAQLIKDLIETTQSVLKGEWRRVKQGESAFRLAKWGAPAVIVCFAVLFLLGSVYIC